jgi:hypothetical protein
MQMDMKLERAKDNRTGIPETNMIQNVLQMTAFRGVQALK